MMADMLDAISWKAPDAAERFVASLESIGFAVLTDHPVGYELVTDVHEAWSSFFSDGARFTYTATDRQDGYYPPTQSETAVGAPVADLKEFFHWYPWGQCPPDLVAPSGRLADACTSVASTTLGWIDPALPRLLTGAHRTLLRILHYPPLTGDEPEGAVRAAAHEDVNLITVLPAASAAGLEVLDRSGEWHAVAADPGMLVVNVGDGLQLATGGRLPSTTHRVANPTGDDARRGRLSTPLFLHAADRAELAPGRSAVEFLQERILTIRGTRIS